MIRVLLIDDDPVYLEGLRQLLSLADDIQVVGQAASPEEALATPYEIWPDVVLLDADLPDEACPTMVQLLSTGHPEADARASVICLAVYPDQHEAAIRAGAVRFLRKDGSPRELLEAVRAVSAGKPGDVLLRCTGLEQQTTPDPA